MSGELSPRAEAALGHAAVARTRHGRRLSLVIPMHNEAPGLDSLFARLDALAPRLGVSLEIVCVDDGSSDGTLDWLSARTKTDPRLRVLSLTRNFGKEAALTAGLEAATGDLVVPLDADLQDPPELIAEFIGLWEQGYDVVYGVRTDRREDSALKRLTAHAFYRVFNLLSERPIPASTGDFRLMDRQVVDAILTLPERSRFMKGLFAWVGYRQVGVPYSRPGRTEGVSSWGYFKLWRFAIDGITSFSTAPLKVWTTIGVMAALLAVVYGLILIGRAVIIGRDAPGYASMMVVILFGFALQMIAFGVIGEYIGRIYEEVKGRPLYVVRKRLGFDR